MDFFRPQAMQRKPAGVRSKNSRYVTRLNGRATHAAVRSSWNANIVFRRFRPKVVYESLWDTGAPAPQGSRHASKLEFPEPWSFSNRTIEPHRLSHLNTTSLNNSTFFPSGRAFRVAWDFEENHVFAPEEASSTDVTTNHIHSLEARG